MMLKYCTGSDYISMRPLGWLSLKQVLSSFPDV